MFQAKVKETSSSKKVNHEVHQIKGELIGDYVELKNTIDNATGKLKMIEGKLKDEIKRIFCKEYEKKGRCPENFKITDSSGSKLLGIVQDRYTTCDQAKYDMLKSTNLVEQKTTFTFNSELLEKYQSIIENLLMNSPDIDESDKHLLIEGVMTFNVKKGAILELKSVNQPLSQTLDLINPVIQLKTTN